MHEHNDLLIGVFDDADKARDALAVLRRSGFRNEQIGVIARHAGPLAGDPSFTAWDEGTDSIMTGLETLGLTEDEARACANELGAGHILVAVRAGKRCPEAWDLLRGCGAAEHSLAGLATYGNAEEATPY
jgi:hypothetical protein